MSIEEALNNDKAINDNANNQSETGLLDGDDRAKEIANGEVNDEEKVTLPSDEKKPDNEKDNGSEDKNIDGMDISIDEFKNHLYTEYPKVMVDKMSDEELAELYKSDYEVDSGSEEPNVDNDGKPENISADLWAEANNQLAEDGKLTDEIYDRLNEQGIPDEVIDNYIDGINAKNEAELQKTADLFGGMDKFSEMYEWAKEYYGEDTLAELENMSYKQLEIASKGIMSDYNNQNANKFNRPTGSSGNNTTGKYTSQEDYLNDIRDSRYGRDNKYTKAVDDKFAISGL